MVVDINAVKELKYLKKYFWKSFSRWVCHCKVGAFEMRKEDKIIGYLLKDSVRKIPEWYLTAKGITLVETESFLSWHSLNEMEEVTITDAFWTCACTDHWINHKTQTECPVCNLHWTEDTKRNPILKGGEYDFDGE